MCRSRFEEKDLRQDDLVVELFQLLQQFFRHGEGLAVVLGIDVAANRQLEQRQAGGNSQCDKLDL